MSSATVEKPRTSGPGSDLGGNWRVIVRNDSHNTFDHVAQTLARVPPGVNLEKGHRIADPTGLMIALLEKLGVVWNVVRVSPERQSAKALPSRVSGPVTSA